MKKAVSLLLALLLCLSSALAAGSAYPDLPETHWAYGDLTRAVQLGILSGLPDGAMRPDAPLTWGQYLTMLRRAFYPETAGSENLEGAHWAFPAYEAALQAGVLHGGDFLPVNAATLDAVLTRQDAAVLLHRVLAGLYGMADADTAQVVLSDFGAVPEAYRPSVAQVCARGLVSGYPDGSFGGGDPLSRAAGTSLLLRLADLGSLQICPEEIDPPGAPEPSPEPVPEPAAETVPALSSPASGPLTELGENADKRQRLFNSTVKRRFDSQEEAETHMTDITVPVWRLDEAMGQKSASSCTLLVHEALADEMVQIFTEIFDDPEQFPIKNVGGYAWRGDAATGEHNCGTAIDINWEENYQINAAGQVMAGTCWAPGENSWSIPEDGSVVRIFAAHGFSWGGSAWPTNKDYMHFSYMGL